MERSSDIEYVKLSAQYFDEVYTFIYQYINVEPPEKMLRLTKDEVIKTKDIKEMLQNEHSVIAVDKNTKNICGIVVAYTYSGNYANPTAADADLSSKLQLLLRFYDHSLKPVEKMLRKNNCAILDYLIVDKGYQQRGIATKLVERMLSEVEKERYRYIIAIATSAFSQKILSKLRFTALETYPYLDYIDTKTNARPFLGIIQPHTCAKTMAFPIRANKM